MSEEIEGLKLYATQLALSHLKVLSGRITSHIKSCFFTVKKSKFPTL